MTDAATTSASPDAERPTIRVIVADDHALVREGIRHVLEAEPEFEVVAEAANGEEALEAAIRHTPDVIVLDVTMPGASGLQIAPRLRAVVPAMRILILSMHENVEYMREGVRAGIHGYLLKDSAAAELRLALRTVCAGGTYFSESLVRRLGEPELGEPAPAAVEGARPGLSALTGRERQVLEGIARGLTNKEIAAELVISPRTVEAHRESLMRKLGIRTVAGLTRFLLDEQGR